MADGAHTPEELEALLEDAVVLGDREAVAVLFEDGVEIPALARERVVTRPVRVRQRGDLALVIGNGTKVLRRLAEGSWRCVIIDTGGTT